MSLTVKHPKVNKIAAWTQAVLDSHIAAGNFPAGTTINDITLSSDWNTDHTITGSILVDGVTITGDGIATPLVAASGTGTVTSVSVTTANGVSGTVTNPNTTPAITLALGAITPTSVTASGTVSGSNLSGTNTGDQTTITGNSGTATKLQTARLLAGNSFDGSANVSFTNKFIVQGTTDTGLTGAQFLGALGTGIVKNTTTTGVLSIAVAADFPTLNQSTTGSAANLTTARTIAASGDAVWSVSFDGSANVTSALTLATVNSNVGTFNNVTVNAKGLVTAATNVSYQAPLTLTTTGTSGPATLIGSTLNIPVPSTGSGATTYINTIKLDQTPASGSYGTLAGLVNGSNALFTVSNGSYVSGTLAVTLNGQMLTQGASYDFVETAPASGTFTFNTPPPTGSIAQAQYITNATALGTNTPIRVVTAAGSITVTNTDYTVVVNKTTGAATAVSLPVAGTGQIFVIKDGKGDSNTNNITITPTSGLIDGAANYVISTNKASVTVQYDGSNFWVT